MLQTNSACTKNLPGLLVKLDKLNSAKKFAWNDKFA